MQHAVRRTLGVQSLQCGPVRPHAVGQRRDDSALHPQLAQAAFAAGHRHQQRCQHAGHGCFRAPGVLRSHHSPLAAGHRLCHRRPAAHLSISEAAELASSSCSSSAGCRQQGSLRSQSSLTAVPQRYSGSSCEGTWPRPSLHWRLSSNVSTAAFEQRAAEAAAASTAAVTAEPSAVTAQEAAGTTAGSDAASSSSSSSSTTSSSSSGQLQLDPVLGRHSYRLIISYDGTAYSGWQLQARAPTIQAQIERSLSTVLREDRRTLCVCAAGRTDAGVHARGQVVQFMTNSAAIDPGQLPYKLNSLLPHDIRVLWASRTAPDFNVTVSALHKTYHYHLDLGPCHDPLRVRYSHHCRRPLDLDAMRSAAALLVGTHDFTQFSNTSLERLRRNPVKTLTRLELLPDPSSPAAMRLEVQGSGFLYKQVRHMTGALLAVGEGRLQLDDVSRLLELGSAEPPGAGGAWRGYNVAPAKGLQLFEVAYAAAVDDPGALLYPALPHDEFGRLLLRIPGASSVDEE